MMCKFNIHSLFLVIIYVSIICTWAAPRRTKSGKVKSGKSKEITLEYVYKRLQFLTKKNGQALKKIARLQENLSRVGASLGKFADDPPCPDKTPGFYHGSKFQSCYHLEPRQVTMNWTDAQVLCKRLSPKAHLVNIESEDEQFFLQAKWQNERGIGTLSRFWTSGQRKNNTWVWNAGGNKMKFTNWIPTAEHNNEAYKCVSVFSHESYLWAGIACWAPLMVTCEIDL